MKYTVETARVTVESCDRSPHSATKVNTKALMKIALQHRARKRSVFVVQPTLFIEATLPVLFNDLADPKQSLAQFIKQKVYPLELDFLHYQRQM